MQLGISVEENIREWRRKNVGNPANMSILAAVKLFLLIRKDINKDNRAGCFI